MIVLLAAIGGAAWGAYLAKKRGGNRLDMAQYAGVFGIVFALIGLFATIYIERMLV